MTGYKLSRFSVTLPAIEGGGEYTAVYNTLTTAFFLMPSAQWAGIAANDSSVDSKDIFQLIQSGILVNNKVDETRVFQQWRDRSVNHFKILKSKVLVTRRCNNRCAYCIIDPEAKGHDKGKQPFKWTSSTSTKWMHSHPAK